MVSDIQGCHLVRRMTWLEYALNCSWLAVGMGLYMLGIIGHRPLQQFADMEIAHTTIPTLREYQPTETV